MATANPIMIDIQHLYRSFDGREVLKDINLQIRTGKTRVILGLSGSGKTVLMKHMIGLLRPTSGDLWVDGQSLHSLSSQDLLQLRRKFGMVFQQAALFDSMTVAENVAFPLREHTDAKEDVIRAQVHAKLELLRIAHAAHQYPSELSGGMRKRVGLARAVILNPQVVLYDEPTTGLDPLSTLQVDNMILDAQERFAITSVVISHDVGSALRIADDIAVIHDGHIVEDCPASQIRSSKHPFVQQFLTTWFGQS